MSVRQILILVVVFFAFAKAHPQSEPQKRSRVSKLLFGSENLRDTDSVIIDLPKIRSLDLAYSYGTILQHNPDISHLITDHPVAFMGFYNRQTLGEKEWQARYNYPEWGLGFAYQDLRNFYLGEAYSLYGFFNFYLLDRWLQVKVGQGLGYMTKPFHPVENFRNTAYGSQLTSSTLLGLHIKRENIWKRVGFQAGVTIIHYSNANVRAPNNSTNSLLFSAGVNYTIDEVDDIDFIKWERRSYREPLTFNAVARIGWNESDIRGSGQFKFYNLSFYADKRINVKSSLQLGTEVIISEFLKEYRDFFANSRPTEGITGDEPYQRVGIFAGHELHLGKTSLLTQLGYYIFWPIPFESRFYNRIGLQRRFMDNYFVSITVRSHAASAEGVSLGVGYRFD